MLPGLAMVIEEGNIPYDDLVRDLFGSALQVRIPFLGAGVSISGAAGAPQKTAPQPGKDSRISTAIQYLSQSLNNPAGGGSAAPPGFRPETQYFLELAVGVALELERVHQSNPDSDILDALAGQQFPPSSSQLTEAFRAGLRPFEDVAERIGKRLGQSPDSELQSKTLDLLKVLARLAGVSSPPLSGMSAYFESFNPREEVLRRIRAILKNKTKTTDTHRLLARAAARQVRDGQDDCLIITTNYDTLMERALEEWTESTKTEEHPSWLPYVVLWVSNRDFCVRARFGNIPEQQKRRFEACNAPAPPNQFTLKQPEPEGDETESPKQKFVIIYKIHGCIHPLLTCPRLEDPESEPLAACIHDSIVLSDDDYIGSIARLADNGGVIPSCVSNIMRRKPLLFLGYSLSDWNVRGFLKVLRIKAAAATTNPDYTVVRTVRTFEHGFFAKNNIVVLKADLNTFAGKLGNLAKGRYGG
jgi:hypothetical protein